MARADLLIDLVRAGALSDRPRFRKALEALVSEERAKQHHILADRLAEYLSSNGFPSRSVATISSGRSGNAVDLYHEVSPLRRMTDLLLPELVITACEEVFEEHRRSGLLRAHNLEPRNRILLAGPPGNGKTSLAEAFATELAVPLLLVRYESVITSYLGETALRLSKLFELVRQQQCVLFFDEFDVVGKERGDVHETGEIKRVVSSLLLQIDDLPLHVIVVVATNHPELLDRAVWRRFQLRLELPSPSMELAQEWFARFEKASRLDLGFPPERLADHLHGLSFSELEQFSLDVQRQIVLRTPDANPRRIVSDRLDQWKHRFSLDN